ncbi:metallophosphoesterase [Nocardioides marinquilinus]|uniref:Metallophosphoesterase n=1 Tax=Nocardioides marinquilinus TaxID=1210400 RepID=A0ABP9P8U5_9ACTN
MRRTAALTSRALGPLVATGLLTAAYAVRETRQYTMRRVAVTTLPPGAAPLRVLHLSDLHLTPRQRRKQAWLRDLRDLPRDERPDLVVNTGDNLSHRDAVPHVVDALGPLLDLPGVFVHGSNDYFEPSMRNPFRYLLPDDGRRHVHVPQLPWRELSRRFTDAGWLDLTNTAGRLTVGDLVLAFAGVDDPHLEYDDLESVVPADAAADLRLGVAHAPYLRVLDRFVAQGYDAVVAGHTHGGQVCLPWPGGGRALVTNCDLDPSRARGLHRHPAGSRPGDAGSAWLHVSAGLGTNPYTQVRVACRPEATLLTLLPRG